MALRLGGLKWMYNAGANIDFALFHGARGSKYIIYSDRESGKYRIGEVWYGHGVFWESSLTELDPLEAQCWLAALTSKAVPKR